MKRVFLNYIPNPIRIYRTNRLAKLLDLHPSTIWRMRQRREIPEPIEIAPGIVGWSETVVKEWLAGKQGEITN
jgi:predicted DNA-binding transcriptional regulator AlpA